jgi:ubiquinone/menaquinone biosynthesis C-methylase UbiE
MVALTGETVTSGAMQVLQSHEQIRDVNARYHDVAASTYDAKWGIDFGDVGSTQVLGKVAKLLGPVLNEGFGRALEVGAGTGYFGLNLARAGVINELTCTDISAGMVEQLGANAKLLGLENVETICADAESLPFDDDSFDLVFGHAVLHHLPDLDRTFAEFRRVLAPGGHILFAGEPSWIGDRLARAPKRAAVWLAPVWRRVVGAAAASQPQAHTHSDHELEGDVDIHAFSPADLQRLAATAGFTDVTVRGEELLANWFGWFNRGLEASAMPEDVPMWWRHYAFHGYLTLQKLDRRALEPRLTPAIFYNLLVSARIPPAS